MKVLFIVQKLEKTAHGPIVKSIINEMAKIETVDVLYKGAVDESALCFTCTNSFRAKNTANATL